MPCPACKGPTKIHVRWGLPSPRSMQSGGGGVFPAHAPELVEVDHRYQGDQDRSQAMFMLFAERDVAGRLDDRTVSAVAGELQARSRRGRAAAGRSGWRTVEPPNAPAKRGGRRGQSASSNRRNPTGSSASTVAGGTLGCRPSSKRAL